MGVLEVHPWGSSNEDLERPDRIIFDLDPDNAISWQTLGATAAEIRKHLKSLNLVSFLKTTGGKGLHIVVPIQPELEWPDIKEFVHQFVLAMEQQNPDLYLTKMSKAAQGQDLSGLSSQRARGDGSRALFSSGKNRDERISAPSWSDLKADEYPLCRVEDFAQWEKRLKSDPWKNFFKTRQQLSFQPAGR